MNIPQPRFLVLLAARNGAQWIEAQLVSIFRQSGVHVHVVASDDASSDDTPSRIASFSTDGRVTLIKRNHASGSAAQNFLSLIRDTASDGYDFVALSDQDDIWLPEKLARAAARLSESGAAGYSATVTAVWPTGRRRILRQSARHASADFLFEGCGQGCTCVLDNQLYSKIRQYLQPRPNLTLPLVYHDWAIYALARTWNQRWIFDPQPTVEYRQHEGNDTGARSSLAGLKLRFQMFRKGRYARQVHGIARLTAEASGTPTLAIRWLEIGQRKPAILRNLLKATFILRHGRRKRLDRLVTIAAALCGWV